MKKIALFVATLLISLTSFAQEKWNIDNLHSNLSFNVKHLDISFVDGRFNKYEGSFIGNPNKLTQANFNFKIDASSVDTAVEMRDNHLKTADFLDTEKYPTITFQSTDIKKLTNNEYAVSGNITIKEVTKPITFKLTKSKILKDDGNGNTKVGFQGTASLNRFDFGINYDPTAMGIANQINLLINLQFAQVK